MIARLADRGLRLLAGVGLRPLAGVAFIPVLHVERLHDESSFERTLGFVRRYHGETGARAVLTVITPLSPILRMELDSAAFTESDYGLRIRALAEHADIGLHGHYLRDPVGECRPIHNYWSIPAVVTQQVRDECEWLERNALMAHRVYSAGWWHLDQNVVSALRENGFVFDFSPSTARYNSSPAASASAAAGLPGIFSYPSNPGLAAVWAVSSLGDSSQVSFVPRRTLAAFPFLWWRRRDAVVSLYSHDWDLNLEGAMRTVADLKRHGAGFVSLPDLIRDAVAQGRIHMSRES